MTNLKNNLIKQLILSNKQMNTANTFLNYVKVFCFNEVQ